MAIKVGNKEVANITVGSTPVKSVYKGSTKIWPSESWKTVWSSETIYKLKVFPTGTANTSTKWGYLNTITNPVTSSLLKAGKKVRITVADYSATTTESYENSIGDKYNYKMTASSRPTETTYEFDIPTSTGYNQFSLRINSDNSQAYVDRIYFNVKSDGTADILFYGVALRGANLNGQCYVPAVKLTKIEQLM